MVKGATSRVLQLFSLMKKEYGELFEYKKDRFTAARAREWAVELLETGVNHEQFEHGSYQAVYRQKYPIERPYEFIELCKQVGESYPPAAEAFVIACSNCGMRGNVERNWKHGVVFETANRIGWGRLASASEGFFKTFKATYEQVCIEHACGKTFVIEKSHRIAAPKHEPVQAGSAADRKISEQLAKWRSKAVAV